MGAFYIIKYFGRAGAGGGTLYIGRGVVVGTDIQGAKFDGTYQVTGGRMRGVELVEALTHIGQGQDAHRLAMELGNDRRRRAGRRQQPEPGSGVEAREARFDHG